MPPLQWLRPEFKDREAELETRELFQKRTGITMMSLSSHFTRYADRIPPVVAKNGRMKYFLPSELDDFVDWISKNTGTRSDVDVKRADLARVDARIEEAEERVATRRLDLEKAERDLAKFKRQRTGLQSDLEFLEQNG